MRKVWTPVSDVMLMEFYPYNTNKKLSNHFGRTISSIRNRATKLNLVKEIENSGCFKKGLLPWNKGTKYNAGGNSIRTQFKTGNIPINTKYDGAISIRQDSYNIAYKFIRISKGKWRLLHRYEWEKKYGVIAQGMILRCKGDRLNTDPTNWELITRAENCRLNENRKAQIEGLKRQWRMKHLREIYIK